MLNLSFQTPFILENYFKISQTFSKGNYTMIGREMKSKWHKGIFICMK